MKHIDLITTELLLNMPVYKCSFVICSSNPQATAKVINKNIRLFTKKKSRLRNEQKQIILKASNFLSSNKAVRNGMKVNSINIYKTQNNNNRYLDVNLLLQKVISLMQIGSVPSSRIHCTPSNLQYLMLVGSKLS